MKTRLLLLTSLIGLSLLAGCSANRNKLEKHNQDEYAFENRDTIDALDYEPIAPTGINVDGKKDEAVYSSAENISFTYDAREGGTHTMSTDIVFLDEGLLIYSYCNDKAIYCSPNEDVHICYQDSIELYIDPIMSDVVRDEFLQIRLSPQNRVETWIGSQKPTESYKWTPHVVPVRTYTLVEGTVITNEEQDIEENKHSIGVSYELYIPNSSLSLSESPKQIKVLPASVDANGLNASDYTWRSYNGIDNPEAEFYAPFSNPNYGGSDDPLSNENTGWNTTGSFKLNDVFSNGLQIGVDAKRSLRSMSFRFIAKNRKGSGVNFEKEGNHLFRIYIDSQETRLSPTDTSPVTYPGEEDLLNYLRDETDYCIDLYDNGTVRLYNYVNNIKNFINYGLNYEIENILAYSVIDNKITLKIDLPSLGHLTSEAIGYTFEYDNLTLKEEGDPEYSFKFAYVEDIVPQLNVSEYIRMDQSGKIYRFPNNERIGSMQVLQKGTAPTHAQYGSRMFDSYILYYEDYFTLFFKTQDGLPFHKDFLYNLEVHVDVMDLIADVPDTKYVIMNWSDPVCDGQLYSDNTGDGYTLIPEVKIAGQFAVNSYCMSYRYTDFPTSTGIETNATMLRFQMATASYSWDKLNVWESTEKQFVWWNGTGRMSYKGTTTGKYIELNHFAISPLYGDECAINIGKNGISIISSDNQVLKLYKQQGFTNQLVIKETGELATHSATMRLSLSYGGTSKWNWPVEYGTPTNQEISHAAECLLANIDLNNVDPLIKNAFMNAYNGCLDKQKTLIEYREVPLFKKVNGYDDVIMNAKQIIERMNG